MVAKPPGSCSPAGAAPILLVGLLDGALKEVSEGPLVGAGAPHGEKVRGSALPGVPGVVDVHRAAPRFQASKVSGCALTGSPAPCNSGVNAYRNSVFWSG